MDGGKRTTSIEWQTIRIAESSVMDSWKALLRLMCQIMQSKFNGKCQLPLYQRVGMEVIIVDQDGLWSVKGKFWRNGYDK